MNFKIASFLYLAINLILGGFFFAVGVLSLALPWSALLQAAVIRFISQNTLMLSLFGLGLVLTGVSLVIYTFLNARRRYATIRTGSRSVSLDRGLIEQYLESYWKERFPHHPIPFQIHIRKHSLQIVADLPAIPESEQPPFLESIKNDFAYLFGQLLGYPHDVHFMASFQTEKTEEPLSSSPRAS